MIIVSTAFIICWFPNSMYFLVVSSSGPTSSLAVGVYPTVFLAYLNICMNPFIYATKHEGVRRQLAGLVMVCRAKRNDVGDVPGNSSNRAAGAKPQTN